VAMVTVRDVTSRDLPEITSQFSAEPYDLVG
jgi:hypothetical protein